MKIEILEQAKRDLIDGFRFYEEQGVGIGFVLPDESLRRHRVAKHLRGSHCKPYRAIIVLLR